MLYVLQRHPFPVRAFFRDCLVLTYAFPEDILRPLLPPGLILDSYQGHGFLAVALVQTEGLRPAFLPQACGANFFLSGYRIFTRLQKASGAELRGLRILRSDTNRRFMAMAGNLLTHYRYHLARVDVRREPGSLEVSLRTPSGEADLDVRADLASAPAPLPEGSIFGNDLKAARHFAGPLPFTFDYEKQTHSLVVVKGVRSKWNPQTVSVEVRRNTFLERPPFAGAGGRLASAFHVADVPYEWKRGVRVPVPVSRTSSHELS